MIQSDLHHLKFALAFVWRMNEADESREVRSVRIVVQGWSDCLGKTD